MSTKMINKELSVKKGKYNVIYHFSDKKKKSRVLPVKLEKLESPEDCVGLYKRLKKLTQFKALRPWPCQPKPSTDHVASVQRIKYYKVQ